MGKGLIMMQTVNELVNKMDGYSTKMSLSLIATSPTLRFSNIGREEKKYFDISMVTLHSVFVDINNHLKAFQALSDYDEKPWRNLFSKYLTDSAANAISTVQTLPLYVVISKLHCAINNLDYEEKKLPLTEASIKHSIDFLSEQICNSENLGLSPLVKSVFSTSALSDKKKGGNVIYYGAPGTGKSFEIDQLTDESNSIRTVFHSDTQYSDFVGCLRPSMGGEGVEYSYKHGAFIEALVKALNDPNHHYYLIIEEINRAPAAAVFGDLFQLLDRESNGRSKYTIDVIDQDLLKLLNEQLKAPLVDKKLYIPENLTIYATMNSGDQAVMPLDTAFKRRWKFEYKPIDFSICPIGEFEIQTDEGINKINWSDFALRINRILDNASIPEDRHLGPWFVSQDEIATLELAMQSLSGKILMYLWDDVLRYSDRSILFIPNIKTFGSLIKQFKENKPIFSFKFHENLPKTQVQEGDIDSEKHHVETADAF